MSPLVQYSTCSRLCTAQLASPLSYIVFNLLILVTIILYIVKFQHKSNGNGLAMVIDEKIHKKLKYDTNRKNGASIRS